MDFSAKEVDIVVPFVVREKKVYIHFIKVYNIIVVEEWALTEF